MKKVVFCDVDGTLVNRQLQDYLFYIRRHYHQNLLSYFAWGLGFVLKVPLMLLIDHFIDRVWANKIFYQSYKGISSEWYQKFIFFMVKDFAVPALNKKVLQYLGRYDFKETDLYLISGNDVQMIRQLKLKIPVKKVIGTELLVEKKFLSGKIKQSRVGHHKKSEVEELLKKYDSDIQIIVLTDHHSDIPLLQIADVKIVVNPSAKLRQRAKQCHWQIIE